MRGVITAFLAALARLASSATPQAWDCCDAEVALYFQRGQLPWTDGLSWQVAGETFVNAVIPCDLASGCLVEVPSTEPSVTLWLGLSSRLREGRPTGVQGWAMRLGVEGGNVLPRDQGLDPVAADHTNEMLIGTVACLSDRRGSARGGSGEHGLFPRDARNPQLATGTPSSTRTRRTSTPRPPSCLPTIGLRPRVRDSRILLPESTGGGLIEAEHRDETRRAVLR